MNQELIIELTSTSKAILQSIEGLSELQLKFKVSPQVWSIHECMEHIVVTEIAVYRILMQQLSPEPGSIEKVGKEKIKKALADRSEKFESPDDVKPIGRFSSLADLTEKFTSNRKRIADSLAENSIVFDSRLIRHPMLGEMTKKDWLNFLIHHSERHCKQIEEIRSFAVVQMS